MRIGKITLKILSVFLIVAGLALIGFDFFGQSLQAGSTNTPNPGKFSVPRLNSQQAAKADKAAGGPKDKTLHLTIPAMSRVKNAAVPTTNGNDTQALNDHTAIHLKGTGFPWQAGANTYIAGHRLGYVGTKSLLAFYDLSNLKPGDRIYVKDARGGRYVYRVYRKFAVDPSGTWVTSPLEGKSVLTLQSCTLPDYTQRLIIRAALVEKTQA